MKISVVIPAYNEEKYIRKCFDSLKNQDYKDYEIIVSLNVCTDRTEEIARKYKKVKIVKENKKGVTYARQTGTKEAEGEIIASADADSFYPKNWLNQIAFNFKNNKRIAGLYGPIYLKGEPFFLKFMAKYFYTGFLYLSRFIGNDNVAGINFAFRKDIFDRVGGYTMGLESAEDIDLSNKLKKYGDVYFDKKLIVFTSNRKFEGRFFKSLIYHVRNYVNIFLLRKKGENMTDIR